MAFNPADADRLIVYGGTFDPPHRAHIQLPRLAADRIGADGVLYIPAGRPPHKPDDHRTPGRHRLAMLQLAIGDAPDAAISDYELNQPGPSYTFATLEQLRHTLGDRVKMHLLIGVDMALIFDQWVKPDRIEQLAEPRVMARPPHDRRRFLDALPPGQRDMWATRMVDVPAIDISSSELRHAIAEQGLDARSVRDNLAPRVIDYIRAHHLYQNAY